MPETKEKCCSSKAVATLLKFVLGLVLVVLGILAVLGWWGNLIIVFKGCAGLFLILAGLIALAVAKE